MLKSAITLASVAVVSGAVHFDDATRRSDFVATEAQPFEPVSFLFAVKEQNMDKIVSAVERVSNPQSADYGRYLSSQEIRAMTKPRSEDVSTVVNWLKTFPRVKFTVIDDRTVSVSTTVEEASKMLATEFNHLVAKKADMGGQKLLRAGDFLLPSEVEDVATVFGLHGLPLPKAPILASYQANSVSVTPSVLANTYGIKGVTAKRTTTNRMAVEEFQGQTENDPDLVTFFKNYMTDYEVGTDDKIFKFVGDKNKESPQTEAELDIQYIMGVAPGVKSEFWYYANQDFCGDLKNWTDTLVSTDDVPSVHSVSYGWQGELSTLGCTMANVQAVDANFAKIAAKGISIIFASGDSGSGYVPPQARCSSDDLHPDTGLEGTAGTTRSLADPLECCDFALYEGYAGFTYALAAPSPTPSIKCSASDYGKKDMAYSGATPTSVVTLSTGEIAACCAFATEQGPYFSVEAFDSDLVKCSLYATEPPKQVASKGAYSGRAASRAGVCTGYKEVTGTKQMANTTSGQPKVPKANVTLYPSWPASSPYVTAVGATRFTGEAGSEEMASEQFGSGATLFVLPKNNKH